MIICTKTIEENFILTKLSKLTNPICLFQEIIAYNYITINKLEQLDLLFKDILYFLNNYITSFPEFFISFDVFKGIISYEFFKRIRSKHNIRTNHCKYIQRKVIHTYLQNAKILKNDAIHNSYAN